MLSGVVSARPLPTLLLRDIISRNQIEPYRSAPHPLASSPDILSDLYPSSPKNWILAQSQPGEHYDRILLLAFPVFRYESKMHSREPPAVRFTIVADFTL